MHLYVPAIIEQLAFQASGVSYLLALTERLFELTRGNAFSIPGPIEIADDVCPTVNLRR